MMRIMLQVRVLLVATIAIVGAAALCVARPEAAQGPKIDLSEKALVAAALKYVAEYEKSFAFLIADEAYEQSRFGAAGQRLQQRVMRSEMFLTFLPADGEWIAVRDVIDVDGTPVADREDLRQLLSKRDALRGLTSQLVARNARYNIGKTQRNFNEPTLPLLILEAKRAGGVKFERKQVTGEGDATLAVLAFSERDRPTLVGGPQGSVPARGEILIEAATGTVRRTTFELSPRDMRVKLVTTYSRDDKLGLWLPSVFTERYETLGVPRELVTCEAKYTNYRRFEVTARIK